MLAASPPPGKAAMQELSVCHSVPAASYPGQAIALSPGVYPGQENPNFTKKKLSFFFFPGHELISAQMNSGCQLPLARLRHPKELADIIFNRGGSRVWEGDKNMTPGHFLLVPDHLLL